MDLAPVTFRSGRTCIGGYSLLDERAGAVNPIVRPMQLRPGAGHGFGGGQRVLRVGRFESVEEGKLSRIKSPGLTGHALSRKVESDTTL